MFAGRFYLMEGAICFVLEKKTEHALKQSHVVISFEALEKAKDAEKFVTTLMNVALERIRS